MGTTLASSVPHDVPFRASVHAAIPVLFLDAHNVRQRTSFMPLRPRGYLRNTLAPSCRSNGLITIFSSSLFSPPTGAQHRDDVAVALVRAGHSDRCALRHLALRQTLRNAVAVVLPGGAWVCRSSGFDSL